MKRYCVYSLVALSTFGTMPHARACDNLLTVEARNVAHGSVVVRTFTIAEAPRKAARLEWSEEQTTLEDLNAISPVNLARARRYLNWPKTPAAEANRPLPFVRLRFEAGALEHGREREYFLQREEIRSKFKVELAQRAALLKAALAERPNEALIFVFYFGADVMAWRDLEQVAAAGEKAFAPRTWFARMMVQSGVKGATFWRGLMPPDVRPRRTGVVRYPLDYVRRSDRGPEVLFFRSAKP